MKKKIIRIILIILILMWMFIVFGFSSENSNQSSGLSYRVSKIFVKDEIKARAFEPYVRKIAHLTEYMVRAEF